MEGRILCIGGGNHLTSPSAGAQGYEMGRKYEYPPPGKCYRYKSSVVQNDRNEAFPIVENVVSDCDPRYGLVIIEDYLIANIKPSIEQAEWGQSHEFVHETQFGTVRAKDLATQWRSYGAVLLAGELPTDSEIAEGKQRRLDYATSRIDEVKTGQQLRRQGTKGYKTGYDKSDRAWASEYGFVLPETMEALERIHADSQREAQKVECPSCFGMIDPRAKRCEHCHDSWNGLSALEVLTQPVGVASGGEASQAGPEVKRGPGRPRLHPE